MSYLQLLFVFVWFVFTKGLMSYLCYLCLFGSSLPSVVCKSAHVLFNLCLFGSSLPSCL